MDKTSFSNMNYHYSNNCYCNINEEYNNVMKKYFMKTMKLRNAIKKEYLHRRELSSHVSIVMYIYVCVIDLYC
jgi:hypothetical protein